MFRSTCALLALALAIALPGQAKTDSPGAEPLRFASDEGPVAVTTAVVGSDLSLTYDFEKPVRSYLNATDSVVSMELDFDTDNTAKTGWAEVTDLRKGCEFMVAVILRLPSAGKTEEALVSWYVKSKWAEASTNLKVEGSQIHLLIPLSSLGLRKGQKVRVVAVPPGQDVSAQQTLTLR